jgi:hypothetical protein
MEPTENSNPRRARVIGAIVVALLLAFLSFGIAPAGASTAAGDRNAESPFAKAGMWIWYIESSQGGDLDRIIRRARASKIETLYIKSADGTGVWSQFTKSMVSKLERAGLEVCGWHYVYGRSPVAEAKASAAAKRRGADCFVIDAETEYEGNYAGADRYVRKLRSLVGPKFPLGLSTFPYVHYHPAFPYSVFLGPGAADTNLPQVYWKTIGTSVRSSVDITWFHNRLYKRPIHPLGQTYLKPSRKDLILFRKYMLAYDAAPSWWSWQETTPLGWKALAKPVARPPAGYSPITSHPTFTRGSRGDQVVWVQQHLVGAGMETPISGIFGKKTRRAVIEFQKSRGLKADGVIGGSTWRQLLKVRPPRVLWSGARSTRSTVSRASSGGIVPGTPAPSSADLPAVRNELAGGS